MEEEIFMTYPHGKSWDFFNSLCSQHIRTTAFHSNGTSQNSCVYNLCLLRMSKRVENQKRGYRTASEYAAQAAARIQINENGYIDIVSNIKI